MIQRKTHLDGLAIASVVLCCVLWGLNQVASKVTLDHIPPLLQAGSRSLMAAALVALWSWRRGIALAPSSNGTGRAGLLAGSLFAAEFACIFIGLQYTTASRLVVFIYLSPFVVALGMPFMPQAERLRGLQWTGMAVAFAGVAWAFVEGFHAPSAGPRQWWGDALGVAAALLWGSTTLTIRGSRLASAPAEQTLYYQLAVSGVLLTAASWVVGEHWPSPLALPARALWLMGFQTVVVTFASYLLWFWLMRHYPATRLAAGTLLTPLAGLAAGAALLGEPLTARLVLACAAVALGIVLVNRPPAATASRAA